MTIRPDDYYLVLTGLLHAPQEKENPYHTLHFLFDRLCHEMTADWEEENATLENRLCRLCHTTLSGTPEAEEMKSLYLHIRERLERSNSEKTKDEHTIQEDLKRLASVVAYLTGTPPPELLLSADRAKSTSGTETYKKDYIKCLRVIYLRQEEKYLELANYHNDFTPTRIRLEITAVQEKELFGNSRYNLVEGMQLNLIDVCTHPESGAYTCGMIVAEPDFFLDISTIAECFRPYGAHPLNYFMGLLSPEANTRHILLGNIANLFLDELVNETPEKPASYLSSMQKAFRQNPFNIAACHDLKDEQIEKQFFSDCRKHFDQLSYIIRECFPRYQIDREKGMLEPSFICHALGLQGRLDFLTSDFSTFIELKSGKAKEEPGASCISHQENHYVQMMLYFAVLRYNLEIDITRTRAFLLYSRYPALYNMTADWELVKKAIGLRNRIVTLMYHIQRKNSPAFTLQLLHAISPARLNLRNMGGPFWNDYLRKPIDTLSRQLSSLSQIEKEYLSVLFTFITKEQYISKAGDTGYQTVKSSSKTAEMSVAEKLEAGEIIVGLELLKNQITEEEQILHLKRNVPEEQFIPNFREGDRIIIYRRDHPEASARNQQIFKGTLLRLTAEEISIQLLIRQQNGHMLPEHSLYAIERDFADTGYSAMYKNLACFLNADPERRDLLLGGHRPRSAREQKTFGPEKSDLERITEKALAAEDYFLLIGPPGTGKTSQALRKILETLYIDQNSRILLAAYTNRAVDEICNTLISIQPDFPFIRIGQEASCHPRFRPFLLKNKIAGCRRRNEVDAVISGCPVFVATLTTLSTRMELLRMKRFDVAIIDEASQILEPQLIGILCARHQSGQNAIKKFILIGDHKQLPAIVQQKEKQAAVKSPRLNAIGMQRMTESLFERLYRYERNYSKDNDSPFYDMLCRQGRMHPDIAEFPSRYFYENKLNCISLPHQKEKALPYQPESGKFIDRITCTKRLAFFATGHLSSVSYKTNREEAVLTARLTCSLYRNITQQGESFNAATHIGIITPYRHQIAMIRAELYKLHIQPLLDLTIDTVERFQGSQRDIIIYSCCINTPFQLEFISNTIQDGDQIIDRKLNVVLTRARKQLFIIGNPKYLNQNPLYQALIHHIRKKDGYYEKWE